MRNQVGIMLIDGVCPWRRDGYSFEGWWFTSGQLPKEVRANLGFYHLLGIIQGPRKPFSSMPFLEIFVDEMVNLYNEGCVIEYYPVYAPLLGIAQEYNAIVKVALLATSNDLPAANDICGARGHAAPDACRFCIIEGTWHANLHLSSWNAADYVKSTSARNFRRSRDVIRDACIAIEAAPNKSQTAELQKLHHWRELSPLHRLYECGGFDETKHAPVDAMHTFGRLIAIVGKAVFFAEDAQVSKQDKVLLEDCLNSVRTSHSYHFNFHINFRLTGPQATRVGGCQTVSVGTLIGSCLNGNTLRASVWQLCLTF